LNAFLCGHVCVNMNVRINLRMILYVGIVVNVRACPRMYECVCESMFVCERVLMCMNKFANVLEYVGMFV
jgi:hypothetical protein